MQSILPNGVPKIPSSVGNGRKVLADSDAADPKPIGAGPLTGRFSNRNALLIVGVSFFVVSAILFASSYITSGNEVSPIENPGPGGATQALWIFGWISGVAGFRSWSSRCTSGVWRGTLRKWPCSRMSRETTISIPSVLNSSKSSR